MGVNNIAMLHARIAEVPIIRISEDKAKTRNDLLAIEEPLSIYIRQNIDGKIQTESLGITMRTPGHDTELAAGLLFCEGIISASDDIAIVEEGSPAGRDKLFPTAVTVSLKSGLPFDVDRLQRRLITTSSCGLCGTLDLDRFNLRDPQHSQGMQLDGQIIPSLPDQLRKAQPVFQHTGGLHAAGLFNFSGQLLDIREDIGRHNAMDKLIGDALLKQNLPFSDTLVLFSGRVSFDLMQKAIACGLSIVASVGPPSSLAVEMAERYGVTLLGFIRSKEFNIYTHGERLEFTNTHPMSQFNPQ